MQNETPALKTTALTCRVAGVASKPSNEHGTLVEIKLIAPLFTISAEQLMFLSSRARGAGHEIVATFAPLQVEMNEGPQPVPDVDDVEPEEEPEGTLRLAGAVK